jgi:hypothetical protein
MKQWVFVCSAVALLVSLAGSPAAAQGIPVVTKASADFTTHELAITGSGFVLVVFRKGVVPGLPFEVTIGAVGPKGDEGPIGPCRSDGATHRPVGPLRCRMDCGASDLGAGEPVSRRASNFFVR